jgi:hypothetical protein
MQGSADEFLKVRIQKSQARFKRVRDPEGPDAGIGEFFLLVDITALREAVYIPISIASGKKPTGFVYQIEGTGAGSLSTADISCRGAQVTQVTWGTILYAKIPSGKTATFRVLVEMKGKIGKAYTVAINRINYRFDPSDARYQKYEQEVRSKTLTFR